MEVDGPSDDELASGVRLRERLHAAAEIGHQEHATAALLRDALGTHDPVAVAGTGVMLRIGPSNGPQVILRAEMDGLPIDEATGTPWAATGGVMHACGHDVHMAALATVVDHLGRAAELPLGVVAVFQPCEETYPSGARLLLAGEVFDGVDVAGVVAMHVHPDVPFGEVALTTGPVNAGVDLVTITVHGHGGHAAYPHTADDPVLALASTVVALQQVVSRGTDPTHPTVLSLTTMRAGSASNVIPEVAVATGTLRCLHDGDREQVKHLIERSAHATAQASGCRAEVAFTAEEPPLRNDPALTAATVASLPPALRAHREERRSCGADDFAEFGVLGPTLMGFVGLDGHPSFAAAPLHSSRFLPPHDLVGHVAAAYLAAYRGAVRLRGGRGSS